MANSKCKPSKTDAAPLPTDGGASTAANPSPPSSRASVSIEDVLSPDVREQIDQAHDRAAEEKEGDADA